MIKQAKSLRYSDPAQVPARGQHTTPPPYRQATNTSSSPHQQHFSLAGQPLRVRSYTGSNQNQYESVMDYSQRDQSGMQQQQGSLPSTALPPLASPSLLSPGIIHDDAAPRASTWPQATTEHTLRPYSSQERLENLRVYRELVGITAPRELNDPKGDLTIRSYMCFTRPSKNVGYYQSILDEELKATIWYHTSTWFTNALLVIQIGIAAALTALGISSDHRRGIAITTLGAINTAVATALAYLKAKGLPLRALVYRNDLRRLKEQIDYTERQFILGVETGATLDPARAAAGVKATFEQVQKAQEKGEADAQIGDMAAHPAGSVTSPAKRAMTSQPLATPSAGPGTAGSEKPQAKGDPGRIV